MNHNPDKILKYWIEEIVIGLNLCPFAKLPYERNLLKWQFLDEFNIDHLLHLIKAKEPKERLENYLLVFPMLEINFPEFYALKEDLVFELGEECLWDVIAFHPSFQFETEPNYTKVNYVNRSPFPILHLIQKKDLENISAPEGKKINIDNELFLEELPEKKLRDLFHFLQN